MNILSDVPEDAVALQADTFRPVEDGIRLIASACDDCGGLYFPRRRFCGRCSGDSLTDRMLSPRGTIRAFSLIDRKSAAAIVAAPYVQACVALPEGLNIYTVLAADGADGPVIGMPAEVCLAEIGRDGEGRPLIAYVFRASGSEEAR